MASMRGEFDKKSAEIYPHYDSFLLLSSFTYFQSLFTFFSSFFSHLFLFASLAFGCDIFFEFSSSSLFSSSFLNSFIVLFSFWLFLSPFSSFRQIFFSLFWAFALFSSSSLICVLLSPRFYFLPLLFISLFFLPLLFTSLLFNSTQQKEILFLKF